MKLTPATARELQPGQMLRDHEVIGLQLYAGATGKSWRLYYRTRSGKERRPTIGKFPEISLARAREIAKDLKERIARGEDPSAKWKAERAAPTVAELCDVYLREYAERKKAPRSAHEDKLLIERHVKPGLGSLKVAEVEQTDVEAFLEKVRQRAFIPPERVRRDGKATAPGAANHARALLSKMFAFAETWPPKVQDKWRPQKSNPVYQVERHPMPRRKRIATPDELPKLVTALQKLEHTHPAHAACLWSLFLTGGRVGEIVNARTSQLQGNRLVLGIGEHKTSRHIGEKEIVLPRIVLRLLEKLPPSERLFGNIALKRIWNQVRTEMGAPGLQLRDARRTFASFALSLGYTLDQIGEHFAHTDPSTTKGYSWLLESSKAEMVDKVANTIWDVAHRGAEAKKRIAPGKLGRWRIRPRRARA